MDTREIFEAYQRAREQFEQLGSWARRQLSPLEQDSTLHVHYISHRIKSPSSLLTKLQQPDRTYTSLADLTDILGIRIVTYFEDSIARIAQRVERHFQVDYVRSVDKSRVLGPSQFGYRSMHLVCQAPEPFGLGDSHEPATIRFEIQIRTVLQHGWAEIEHDLGYKSAESIPAGIRRRFSRIASLLETADEEFVRIKRELREYEEAVRSGQGEAWCALEIDKLSLEYLARRNPVRTFDEKLAAQLDRPLLEKPFHPEYLVTVLRAAGLDTVRRVESVCHQLADRLSLFVTAYFAFSQTQWGFGPTSLDGVHAGYSLLFFAYLAMLEAESLGVTPLERATRFLQKTDHLDRSAAIAAAELLLQALAQTTALPAGEPSSETAEVGG